MNHALRLTAAASFALALAACQPPSSDPKAAAPDTPAAPAASASDHSLQVLSNRADLVSGGDVLVAVALPAGTKLSDVSVKANGKGDAEFGLDANGRLVARVSG